MDRIKRAQAERGAQATLPPKEQLQAMHAQVSVLTDSKQHIVEGIAIFQDGAKKYIAALPELPGIAPDAAENMQTGLLAIAKGHAGIVLAEIGELRATLDQIEAQLAMYEQKVHLA